MTILEIVTPIKASQKTVFDLARNINEHVASSA